MQLGPLSGDHVGEALQELLLIPGPGTENKLRSCSKISWSYGSLKLQRRKTSCAMNNNHMMIKYSTVTETKHWCTQCTDLIVSTLCWWKWRNTSVESRSLEGWSFHCGGVCWSVTFMGKNSPLSFCRLGKCWMGWTGRKPAWQCGE